MDQAIVDAAALALGILDVQPLAVGGQKYVATAKQADGRDVVLKVVRLSGPHREVGLERARREVDLLGRVDHPNVVKVLTPLELVGAPAAPDAAAWLEERLDGEDLIDRLGTEWSWSDTRSMGLDVGRGLGALHSANAVHRDLSPKNIRCTSAGGFVIMDPGLARHLAESTLTGVFQPGTPGYMTPEHNPAARPTPASDVFALGILMYLALTTRLPVDVGTDLDDYRNRLAQDQVPSIAAARLDLDREQVAVVDRCLQRQSARRYLDGNEFVAALESVS